MKKKIIATIITTIATILLSSHPAYALTDAQIVQKIPTLCGYEDLAVDEPASDLVQMEGRIYKEFLNEFPELVYSASIYKEMSYLNNNGTKYVTNLRFSPTLIAYAKDPNYAKNIQNYIESVITGANISDTDADTEKVKKLAHFIGKNYTYDFTGADENRKNGISFWRSLTEQQKTFCMMDALLFKGCCDRLKIPCTYIRGCVGEKEPVDHAWNRVFVDGKWSSVDCTGVRNAGDIFILFETGEDRSILYEIE